MLLAAAGYPDGFALTIHGPNDRYVNDDQICQAIAQMLSRAGIAMRATASDPVTAATLGVDIRASQRMTWILAGATGTVAGTLIVSSGSVSPSLAASALSVWSVMPHQTAATSAAGEAA
jgi:ABC-type transport system substrate-binding protein